MDQVDERVRRRCGETVAGIMAAVDAAALPRKQAQAIRRAVMCAVHSQGDDTVALIRGIDDDSATRLRNRVRSLAEAVRSYAPADVVDPLAYDLAQSAIARRDLAEAIIQVGRTLPGRADLPALFARAAASRPGA